MRAMLQRTTVQWSFLLAATILPCGHDAEAASEVDTCSTVTSAPVSRIAPHRPGPSLFPHLSGRDFPAAADSVTMRVRAQSSGFLQAEIYHRRNADIGFAALITAQTTTDAQGDARIMTVSRLDDQCMAQAEARALEPERVCARLVATQPGAGVVILSFTDPGQQHVLRFTLARDMRDPRIWKLVPSGRTGEPRQLQLKLQTTTDGHLESRWQVADANAHGTFARSLSSRTQINAFTATRFDEVELGLLNSLNLLDDLRDEHAPWVVYAFGEEIVDSPASPGDEDFEECTIGTSCDAQYQSCTPVDGGWLGCTDGRNDDGWGHGPGYGDGGSGSGVGGIGVGGGGHTPLLYPDWQTSAIPPLFRGLIRTAYIDTIPEAQRYLLNYRIGSVLKTAPTQVRNLSHFDGNGLYVPGDAVAHVVRVRLTDIENMVPVCNGEMRFSLHADGAMIAVEDSATYLSPQDSCGTAQTIEHCRRPPPGAYILEYELDPENLWDEGGSGENNNYGWFNGIYLRD